MEDEKLVTKRKDWITLADFKGTFTIKSNSWIDYVVNAKGIANDFAASFRGITCISCEGLLQFLASHKKYKEEGLDTFFKAQYDKNREKVDSVVHRLIRISIQEGIPFKPYVCWKGDTKRFSEQKREFIYSQLSEGWMACIDFYKKYKMIDSNWFYQISKKRSGKSAVKMHNGTRIVNPRLLLDYLKKSNLREGSRSHFLFAALAKDFSEGKFQDGVLPSTFGEGQKAFESMDISPKIAKMLGKLPEPEIGEGKYDEINHRILNKKLENRGRKVEWERNPPVIKDLDPLKEEDIIQTPNEGGVEAPPSHYVNGGNVGDMLTKDLDGTVKWMSQEQYNLLQIKLRMEWILNNDLLIDKLRNNEDFVKKIKGIQ